MTRLSIALACLTLAVSACSAANCESVCLEAQERDCTVIADCSTFCANVNTLADNAGCRAEADALESCSGSVDACTVDAQCSSEENALASCAAPYCLANASAPECSL